MSTQSEGGVVIVEDPETGLLSTPVGELGQSGPLGAMSVSLPPGLRLMMDRLTGRLLSVVLETEDDATAGGVVRLGNGRAAFSAGADTARVLWEAALTFDQAFGGSLPSQLEQVASIEALSRVLSVTEDDLWDETKRWYDGHVQAAAGALTSGFTPPESWASAWLDERQEDGLRLAAEFVVGSPAERRGRLDLLAEHPTPERAPAFRSRPGVLDLEAAAAMDSESVVVRVDEVDRSVRGVEGTARGSLLFTQDAEGLAVSVRRWGDTLTLTVDEHTEPAPPAVLFVLTGPEVSTVRWSPSSGVDAAVGWWTPSRSLINLEPVGGRRFDPSGLEVVVCQPGDRLNVERLRVMDERRDCATRAWLSWPYASSVDELWDLAVAFVEDGRFDQALAAFQLGAHLRPDDERVWADAAGVVGNGLQNEDGPAGQLDSYRLAKPESLDPPGGLLWARLAADLGSS